MTKLIKLESKVTLTVDAPRGFGENIKDAAAVRRDYGEVLRRAIKQQDDFAGLTPDWCSEDGFGVESFEVTQL